MKTKRDRLAQLREQFDELTDSLARSGKKRNGMTWQTDRLKAREQIRREIELLENVPPVPNVQPRRLTGSLIAYTPRRTAAAVGRSIPLARG